MDKVYLPDTNPNDVFHQRKLLAEALYDVLVAAGMLNADTQPNGAELVQFAEEFVEMSKGAR
jgi:hypothetical protein